MTPPSRQFKILDPRLPAGTDSMDWTNGLAVGTLAICATIIGRTGPSFPRNSPYYSPHNRFGSGTTDEAMKRIRNKMVGEAKEQKRSPSFVQGMEASFSGLWEIYLR